MARRKRSGGRRRGTVLTPKKLLVAAPALIGAVAAAKQVIGSYKADGDALHATTGIVLHGSGMPTLDKNVAIGIATKLGGGIIASKVVGKGLGLVSKSAPMAAPLLNAKLVRV